MIEHIYNTNGLGSIMSKPADDGRYFYFKPADGKKITKITVIEKGVWSQGVVFEGEPVDSTQTISLDVIWEEGLKGVVKLFFLSSRPLWDGSITVNVEGEDEQIDIVVFGDTEHQEQRAFSIATSSTNTDTWIYRKTSNAHTYTKAVGFNDEYKPDGNSTPSKYALIPLYL